MTIVFSSSVKLPVASNAAPCRGSPHPFDPGSVVLALQPPLSGCHCGSCFAAGFGSSGGPPHQIHESIPGILTISLLAAKASGIDDQHPFFGDPLAAKSQKSFPYILRD